MKMTLIPKQIRNLSGWLFFTLAILCSTTWANDSLPAFTASQGMLDLSRWNFEYNGNIRLDGEWGFFWNQLIMPENMIGSDAEIFVNVPSEWNHYQIKNQKLSSDGYGTFVLTVLLPKTREPLALRILDMATAYRIWVNGKPVASNGVVGTSAGEMNPQFMPQVVTLNHTDQVMRIVVQISNFYHAKGGFWRSIELGTESNIRDRQRYMLGFEMFLLGAVLIMALYHLGLFALRNRETTALYFGLFCLVVALRVMLTGERLMFEQFRMISWEWLSTMEHLTFYLGVPLFAAFLRALNPEEFSAKMHKICLVIGGLFSVLVLVTPTRIYSMTLVPYQLNALFWGIYALGTLVLAMKHKRDGSILVLICFIFLFITTVNDMVYSHTATIRINLLPLGLFIFIFAQAFILSQRFSKAFASAETLSEKLSQTMRT
ncbi:MAG: 7TM-DISM domain-containing protein [SAR324 cluster bacterium]|nr:7TM-DISM domain-containing protein [SAR324 cluster bacterium]